MRVCSGQEANRQVSGRERAGGDRMLSVKHCTVSYPLCDIRDRETRHYGLLICDERCTWAR